MSLTSEFSVTNKAMTYIQLASAIELDSEDTINKLLPVFDLFTTLELTDDNMTILDTLMEFQSKYGNNFTLCTNDGDIIQFYVDASHGVLRNVDENGSNIVTLIDNGVKQSSFELDGELIQTTQNTYSWSMSQILSSLSQQIKSCNTLKRLANMAQKDNVSLQDIECILQTVSINDDPQLFAFANAVRDVGGALSGSAIAMLLQKAYYGISNATAVNDTIDFDDTDWSVKSFNGTVVFQAISSGAQMLGSVLLIAGGAVGKIIGAGILFASSVSQALINTLGKKEQVAVDFNARNYEYAVPLHQTTQGKATFNSDIQFIVENYKVCQVQTMYGNWYIWDAGDNVNYRLALYLNLLMDWPIFTMGQIVNKALCDFVHDDSDTTIHDTFTVYNGPLTLDSATRFNIPKLYKFTDNNDLNYDADQCYKQLLNSDDESCRKKVAKAILCSMLFYKQCTKLDDESDIAYTFTAGYQSSTLKDWADYIFANMPVPSSDPVGAFDICLLYLLCYDKSNAIPSWSDLNNKIIPAYNIMFQATFWNTNLFARLFNYTNYPTLYGNQKSLIKVSYFRDSYLIIPPQYEPGSLLGAVVTGLLAAAAITAGFIVGKRLISRKLTSFMFDKYTAVQRSYDSLVEMTPGTPEYRYARNSYLKQVRKYNFLAGVLGRSSISSSSGWETGDVAVTTAYASCTGAYNSVVPLIQSIGGSSTDDVISNVDITKAVDTVREIITGPNWP